MEDQQALPPVVVDIIAKVSGLSAVIGDVTSIRGDGRMMAWAGKDDYWFWLVVEHATSLERKAAEYFPRPDRRGASAGRSALQCCRILRVPRHRARVRV